MKVKVIKMGFGTKEVEVSSGAHVEDALEEAGLSSEGFAVSVNGEGASGSTSVNEGDIITMNPKAVGA